VILSDFERIGIGPVDLMQELRVLGGVSRFVIPSEVCEARNLRGAIGLLPVSEVMKRYWVYIVTNRAGTLYVGVTNDLQRRLWEHKNHLLPGFTSRYVIDRVVYVEETNDVTAAIEREKEIKGWRRSKKEELIESANPKWRDLSLDW